EAQERWKRAWTCIGPHRSQRSLAVAAEEESSRDFIEPHSLAAAGIEDDALAAALEHRCARDARKASEQRRDLVGPLDEEAPRAQHADELLSLRFVEIGEGDVFLLARGVEGEEEREHVAAHLRDIAGQAVPDEGGVAAGMEGEMSREREDGHDRAGCPSRAASGKRAREPSRGIDGRSPMRYFPAPLAGGRLTGSGSVW